MDKKVEESGLYVDLRFKFSFDSDDDYASLETVERIDSTMSQRHLAGATEMLAQSDRWNVEWPNWILDAFEGH